MPAPTPPLRFSTATAARRAGTSDLEPRSSGTAAAIGINGNARRRPRGWRPVHASFDTHLARAEARTAGVVSASSPADVREMLHVDIAVPTGANKRDAIPNARDTGQRIERTDRFIREYFQQHVAFLELTPTKATGF